MSSPKKKPFQDYYLLFGIAPDATSSEIKTAYRELALKLHPDKNPSPEAHKQFLLLNEAYRILNNPKDRNKYDIRYKHYYNPHKKAAGINERIERTRAKRASRYGRTMYSQRMRYRGTGGTSASSSRQRKYYTQARNSNYDWGDGEKGTRAGAMPSYLVYLKILAVVVFLLGIYNLADYFITVPSQQLKIQEKQEVDNNTLRIIARKYYYQNVIFYVRKSDEKYFDFKHQVQLERSYFKGRLYKIRVHTGSRILLFDPINSFYDTGFYYLMLICLSSLACLLITKQRRLLLHVGTLMALWVLIYFIVSL